MENPAKPLSKEDYEKHSRAMVLYRILLHHSCSPEQNQEILFRILESSIDPLLFDGVVSVANTFKMRMGILLEHAGYFFDGSKVYKLGKKFTSKLPPLKAISSEAKQRIETRVVAMKKIVVQNEEREKLAKEVLKLIQKMPSVTLHLKNDKEKLRFYPDTGDITLRGEQGKVNQGSKGFALLTILDRSKNTPFTLEQIKGEGNPLVNNHVHYFKKEKDVDDTIHLLKSKLKVGSKAFFPIEKKGAKNDKKWIWIEK